jgi:hypothetical protein
MLWGTSLSLCNRGGSFLFLLVIFKAELATKTESKIKVQIILRNGINVFFKNEKAVE